MGAYLSEPVLEKHSEDGESKLLNFGSSSMQGWRVSQEDAHNAIIEYDQGKSFFAVYDGHGGHEVAAYCAQKLPDFLKNIQAYKDGDFEKALEECFISFDSKIIERDVVEELKKIAGCTTEEKEAVEEHDSNEVNNLCEEASMPIEEVIAKLAGGGGGGGGGSDVDEEVSVGGSSSSSSEKPLNPSLRRLKENKKLSVSPFLRAKTNNRVCESETGPSNKHIHFNEDGEMVENGSVSEETVKTEKDEVDTKPKLENGENGEDVKVSPATPVNGDVAKDEASESVESSPEGSEKENKDTNGAVPQLVKGDSTDDDDYISMKAKGKGKGKGKGKSRGTSDEAVTPVAEEIKKKPKKSATEIYETLLKTNPEEGDEESEDSDDEEFGEDLECADSDDSDGGEEDIEDESEEEADSDDGEEEEEEEEEDEIPEADFTEEPGNDSGCTAVVALLAGTKLFVANAGDSRCVVCRGGVAHEMSFDHKPEDEVELNRINKAGGKVTPDGRVNGGLNLSRAIGDHAYKQNKELSLSEQMISPQPDVKVLDIDPTTDEWMILACDGIWNFMSSQEVVDYVSKRISTTPDNKLSTICEELFEHCLAPDTMGDGTGCDNMTAVIVKFKPAYALVNNDDEIVATVNGTSKRPIEDGDDDVPKESLDTNKKIKLNEDSSDH